MEEDVAKKVRLKKVPLDAEVFVADEGETELGAGLLAASLDRVAAAMERVADAAEQIAEKEESPRPETSSRANPTAGFINRVRNRMHSHGEDMMRAVQHVRGEMHLEQEGALHELALAGRDAPMYTLPPQYRFTPTYNEIVRGTYPVVNPEVFNAGVVRTTTPAVGGYQLRQWTETPAITNLMTEIRETTRLAEEAAGALGIASEPNMRLIPSGATIPAVLGEWRSYPPPPTPTEAPPPNQNTVEVRDTIVAGRTIRREAIDSEGNSTDIPL
jgi:hypothetical protein